jgi:hypothetical protein
MSVFVEWLRENSFALLEEQWMSKAKISLVFGFILPEGMELAKGLIKLSVETVSHKSSTWMSSFWDDEPVFPTKLGFSWCSFSKT